MKTLIWDFDGVIVDSIRECHEIFLATLDREKTALANYAGVSELSETTFENFSEFRSKSVNSADFYGNYILLQQGRQLNDANLSEISSKIESFLRYMDAVFYEERDRLLKLKGKAYYDSLKVYPGIAKTLKKLSEAGIRQAIMSARDKGSIAQIILHFSIPDVFEYVIGHEVDKGSRHVKEKQIKLLKVHFEQPPNPELKYYFIDDIPFNLKKAQGFATLLFPAWGYGKLDPNYVSAQVIKKPDDLVDLLLEV
ncbi:MAG: HAD family hydrolase [Candidatus Micrarchaeota archaeon]